MSQHSLADRRDPAQTTYRSSERLLNDFFCPRDGGEHRRLWRVSAGGAQNIGRLCYLHDLVRWFHSLVLTSNKAPLGNCNPPGPQFSVKGRSRLARQIGRQGLGSPNSDPSLILVPLGGALQD